MRNSSMLGFIQRRLVVVVSLAMLVALLPLGSAGAQPEPVEDPTNACPVDPPVAPFTDRDEIPDVHVTNVDCGHFFEIALGFADNTFRPSLTTRRDQMAAFIARTLEAGGFALPAATGQRFLDVPPGHTHDDDIHRLAAAGIVFGGPGDLSSDFYGPSLPVIRAQMASFIIRALEYAFQTELTPTGNCTFDDDTQIPVHTDNIRIACDLGITVGQTAAGQVAAQQTNYNPGGDTRRDQMMAFLIRLLSILLQDEPDEPTPDPTPTPTPTPPAPGGGGGLPGGFNLTLDPQFDTNDVGQFEWNHEVTATLRHGNNPQAQRWIRFEVYRDTDDDGAFDLLVVHHDSTDVNGQADINYSVFDGHDFDPFEDNPGEDGWQDIIVACQIASESGEVSEGDRVAFCAVVDEPQPEQSGEHAQPRPRTDRASDDAEKWWFGFFSFLFL